MKGKKERSEREGEMEATLAIVHHPNIDQALQSKEYHIQEG